MADLVVQSKVKAHVSSLDMRSSSDLADALDEKVKALLVDAAARAKAHGKSTIKPHDL
ncbi:MAG: histone H3/H4 [Nonlabens sp.]|jgi:histone H3/H4